MLVFRGKLSSRASINPAQRPFPPCRIGGGAAFVALMSSSFPRKTEAAYEVNKQPSRLQASGSVTPIASSFPRKIASGWRLGGPRDLRGTSTKVTRSSACPPFGLTAGQVS